MSLSLRDQLLAAGLVTKKQVKQANPPVRPPQVSKNKPPVLPPAALAAQRAQAEKFARDQALNRKQQEKAERKARLAQLRQLIEQCRIPKIESDDYYNFVDTGKVRRLPVNATLRAQIGRGELVIARCGDRYDLVPASAAARIAEREATAIINAATASTAAADDDAYKAFVVPDDLTW